MQKSTREIFLKIIRRQFVNNQVSSLSILDTPQEYIYTLSQSIPESLKELLDAKLIRIMLHNDFVLTLGE